MNALHHSPLATSTNATVMETIMKPLSFARRPARWLMAAGLALAAMQGTPAMAQPAAELLPEGSTSTAHRAPSRATAEAPPFFEKIGKQIDCDYVVYRLRFGARGDPAKFLDPEFIAEMQDVRIDLRDTLPAGLEIVDVQVSGDGTAADGGPLPAPAISTVTNPNDTMRLDNFRVSTSDLDGSGEIDRRYVDFVITAKIDHAAFPAPTIVANQGFATVTRVGGIVVEIPSHDPALPDDGNLETGEPTKILIDVTAATGRLRATARSASRSRQARSTACPAAAPSSTTCRSGPSSAASGCSCAPPRPAVIVAPLSQFVPIGGGVLNWTITGASAGRRRAPHRLRHRDLCRAGGRGSASAARRPSTSSSLPTSNARRNAASPTSRSRSARTMTVARRKAPATSPSGSPMSATRPITARSCSTR